MQKLLITFFILFGIVINSHAIFESAEDIDSAEHQFISAELVDMFGDIIVKESTVDTTIADELDIFIFNDVPLSVNIPSSIFYRAKDIHNDPNISDYEKRIQFYYLTVEAVDKFYDYAIELREGARDIANSEDEVEALLAFMQIIYNDDHDYKDLVQLETIEKMNEIFVIIDVVVKKQIESEMAGKTVFYSVYEMPQMASPIGEDENYLPTITLNYAKEIHQNGQSIYQKKRDILFLVYKTIDRLLQYIYDIESGKKDPVVFHSEIVNIYNFLQVIDSNTFDYKELVQEAEILKIEESIYRLEILLNLREPENVYME